MPRLGFFTKNFTVNPLHLPTILLFIGYPIFWTEIFLIKPSGGRSTPLAFILFALIASLILSTHREYLAQSFGKVLKAWKVLSLFWKVTAIVWLVFSACLLLITFFASLLPPHLSQEFDALNYHITIPRQHLIRHSFNWIPWSSADLFLLPIQFALAPYWLATWLPNKVPQFFFCLFLLLIVLKLIKRIKGSFDLKSTLAFIGLFFGTHMIGIQLGTAMLDLVACYLFFAALDSWADKQYALCALESSFFFWSKPFVPIQIAVILITLWLLACFFCRLFGFKKIWTIPNLSKGRAFVSWVYFGIVSLVIAGPFIVKSYHVSGTPLYPFYVSEMRQTNTKTESPQVPIRDSAKLLLKARNNYGYGRGPIEFVKHFFLIAVPNKNVNNVFDYPIGLTFLICLAPFIVAAWNDFYKKRAFDVLSWFVMVLWIFWWLGSQQSRFLFVPLLLIFVRIVIKTEFLTKTFACVLSIAIVLTTVSVVRANRGDLFKKPIEVLRDKDRMLVNLLPPSSDGAVELDFVDAAFASYRVDVIVKNRKDPFVIPFNNELKGAYENN